MPDSTTSHEHSVHCVSVVIPAWGDEERLPALVESLARDPHVHEILVSAADAGARWLAQVDSAGGRCLHTQRPHRGRQLNLGARAASGEWLLFNHADTILTSPHIAALAALTPRAEVIGGAFHRKFDSRHPHCRWLEPIERRRNLAFGALYGDQSLFVRRAHFDTMGGFADIPLMEDVEFSRRLRRSGRIALLDPPIASSPRKHLRCGPWRTTLQNAGLLSLYSLGFPPELLHRWYYPNTSHNHETHHDSPRPSRDPIDAPR